MDADNDIDIDATDVPEDFKLVNRRQFMASEENLAGGIKVLEVGCGSGIWTLEMARDYPASTFVGCDIANVLPTTDISDNCTFINANTLEGLPFPDGTFDYCYQRFMVLAFTAKDWPKAIAELVRVTRSGGYVELFESDCKTERIPQSYMPFLNALLKGTRERGIDFSIIRNLSSLMEGLLTNIVSDYVSCPLGWNGRAGELFRRNSDLAHQSLKPTIAPLMGLSSTEYDEFAANVGQEFRNHKSWMKAYYAYGVKP